MSERIKHFLIVFDHTAGELESLFEFGENGDAAVEAYSAKEKELKDRESVEIVLIGSDSLDTVKLTHANYFDGRVAVSKYLAGISTPLRSAPRTQRSSVTRPQSRIPPSGGAAAGKPRRR
jgi:hypothetical protein